jgi:hypothetical protein
MPSVHYAKRSWVVCEKVVNGKDALVQAYEGYLLRSLERAA